MSPTTRLLACLLVLMVLAGCSRSVKETFGLDRRAPDEFQVVRRAPLIVPPDARLRPPQPGAEGPASSLTSNEAQTALTGQQVASTSFASPAEQQLVAATPGQTTPNIRQVIAQEDSQVTLLDRGTFLFILGWQRQSALDEQAAGDTLDPVAESRRLQGSAVVQTARTASAPVTR